jgi:MoaA/NifB/PqqE/SkfB family radical SAM enzyme
MAIERFKSLAPYFREVETVILEGWGEALLHPHLVEAIRCVKASGARAGFVTSGSGLDRAYAAELVTAGVDFLGFSFAGATPRTHSAIRIHSDLERLAQAIRDLNRVKNDLGSERPHVHMVYLMLTDNLGEVSPLLDLASHLGIREVLLINLILVTNTWQNEHRAFSCAAGAGDPSLDQAAGHARQLGVRLHRASLTPEVVGVCAEDPLRNLYISVRGDVAPCVYLQPPTASPFTRIFCGRADTVEKVRFGNLFEESLEIVWSRPDYVDFRSAFAARKRRFEEIFTPFAWGTGLKGRDVRQKLPDPPPSCQSCHKMLGV